MSEPRAEYETRSSQTRLDETRSSWSGNILSVHVEGESYHFERLKGRVVTLASVDVSNGPDRDGAGVTFVDIPAACRKALLDENLQFRTRTEAGVGVL